MAKTVNDMIAERREDAQLVAGNDRVERVARAMFDAWADDPDNRYPDGGSRPSQREHFNWGRSLSHADRATWREMARAAIRATEAGPAEQTPADEKDLDYLQGLGYLPRQAA